MIEGVDALLDHAAPDVETLAKASLWEKVQELRRNLHLVKSAKSLGPVASSFYELMTAPTTKVPDYQSTPVGVGDIRDETSKLQSNAFRKFAANSQRPIYTIFACKYVLGTFTSPRNWCKNFNSH